MIGFKNLFGGLRQSKPPDRKTIENWFYGNWDAQNIQNLLHGSMAALLEQIDADQIVERHASASDLNSNGGELIKGKVLKMLSGPAPGYIEKTLTSSQMAIAERVYNEIRLNRYGELYASAMAMAIFHATMAWYAEQYEHAIALATHVIDDIAPHAGEAYRVRAFSCISLGKFEEAISDLRKALASTPQPSGAAEPLAAIEAFLQQRQAPHVSFLKKTDSYPCGFYRTGIQEALLVLTTFGLYTPIWLIRSRHVANRRLGFKKTPWYFWIMLFIPIVFLYPIYSTLSLLQKSCKHQLPESQIPPFFLFGILYSTLAYFAKLSPPLDLLYLSCCIPIGIMQSFSYKAEISYCQPTNAQTKFNKFEWIIISLGACVIVLAIIGSFIK